MRTLKTFFKARIILTVLAVLLFSKESVQGQYIQKQASLANYLRSHKYDLAIPLLLKNIETDSNSVEDYINLGVAYQGLKRPEKALQPLLKALDLRKGDSDIMMLVARTYSLLGMDKEALQAYRVAWTADSSTISAPLNMAEIYMDRQNYSEAKKIYGLLIEKDTSNDFYLRQLGICTLKMDTLESALDYLYKAMELNHNDPVTANQAAIALIKMNRLDSAAQVIDSSMILFPDICSFKVLRGDILLKQRQFLAAARWFQEAINCGDSTGAVCQKYGASLCMYANRNDSLNVNDKLKYFETANEALIKAYSAMPKNMITCYYLGITNDKIGRWDEAVDFSRQAVELAVPSILADIFTQLAKSYLNKSMYTEALETYRSVLNFRKYDMEALNRILDMIDDKREPEEISAAYLNYQHVVSAEESDVFNKTVQRALTRIKDKKRIMQPLRNE